jgi:hypothetical protein
MKGCVWLICALNIGHVFAQSNADASSISLAGADMVTLRNGYQEQNPATLTQFSNNTLGVQQILRFSIKELQQNSIYVMTKLWSKPIAIGYQHQGFESYKLGHIYLSTALKLNEQLSIGIKTKFQYLHTNFSSTQVLFQPELGCIYTSTNKLKYAVHIQVPFRSGTNIVWRSRIKTGIGYQASKYVNLFYAFEYYELKNPIHAFAINYELIQKLNLNVSLKNKDPFLGLGIQYKLKSIVIENAYNYHSQLGISPCIGVNYLF